MNIRKTLPAFVLTSVFATVSTAAIAVDPDSIIVVPVVSSSPVYETVRINTPRQECWQEAVTVSSGSRSHTPEILGAIVGAGVGRLFGSGRGKDAATVGGAILGSSIGSDLENKNKQGDQIEYQQRCRTVDQYHNERHLVWYDVTYRFNDQLYTSQTSRDPGNSIRVSVTVVPVE